MRARRSPAASGTSSSIRSVHPVDIQDRDGAAFVLNASTRALFPFIERIFADGGYQGPRAAAAAAAAAAATGKWIIEIVKRNPGGIAAREQRLVRMSAETANCGRCCGAAWPLAARPQQTPDCQIRNSF
jgi:hypothetical protein